MTKKHEISKANYEKILKSVSAWPQWKKDFCNKELLVLKNAKKLV